MTEVVSVKFKNRGKTYYFDPAGNKVNTGDDVIVETSKGLEFVNCVVGNHYVPDEKIVPPIRPVVRVATDNDRRVLELNKQREREALEICKVKIAEHGLDMKLVDAECSFEGGKTTFYFTSDGRVDFRELVKDLASVFRNRIELRQIGVRDEAKMLGGIGMCGRPFCCNQFLDEFQPVSTKMAKVQSMSLNPTKISGSCGRLMCCLRYEEEAYEELVKVVPKVGTFVETPAGYGNVTQVNLLRQSVRVKLDGEGDDVIKYYAADEIAVVPGGRPKSGESAPHVLQPKPPAETEPEAEAEPIYSSVYEPEPIYEEKPPVRERETKTREASVHEEFEGEFMDDELAEEQTPRYSNRQTKRYRDNRQRRQNKQQSSQQKNRDAKPQYNTQHSADSGNRNNNKRSYNRRKRPQHGENKQ